LKDKKSKAIVFTTTKNDAREISQLEVMQGRAEALHGDVPQRSREFVLKRFREGKTNTLVATDVASRGLDIPSVNLVIQVEPPKDPESYIHRSGRTARAGNQGVCITLCDQRNWNWIEKIQEMAGVEFKELTSEEIKSKITDSKSALNGEVGMLTFSIKDREFESKENAYKTLCDEVGKDQVNTWKRVTLRGGKLAWDVSEEKADQLEELWKKKGTGEIQRVKEGEGW
jgi:superfamily II DNA/RNA helicase